MSVQSSSTSFPLNAAGDDEKNNRSTTASASFRAVSSACDAHSLTDCATLSSLPSSSSTPSLSPVLMPWVGYGTYRLGSNKSYRASLSALRVGYRQIDTAFAYGGGKTEGEVGNAIQEALKTGIISCREDVFVTTKQWRSYHGYNASLRCLDQSLKRLQLDHVDLWLMHWPGPAWKSGKKRRKEDDSEEDEEDSSPWSLAMEGQGRDEITSLRAETWRAMEEALSKGQTRSIGVSNFTIKHLEALKKTAKVWPPAVNQVECHPYYPQKELLEYCRREGITVQAYASLGGQDATKAKWKDVGGKLLESKPVLDAARAHSGVTPAQVLLRWALQKGCAIIPKSSSEERMAENSNIFHFQLSDGEVGAIDKLSENAPDGMGRLCWRTDPLRMLDFD